MLANPSSKDVPLHALAAVDGDAQLGVLVLAGLQIQQHLLRQLRQEAPVDDVVLRGWWSGGLRKSTETLADDGSLCTAFEDLAFTNLALEGLGKRRLPGWLPMAILTAVPRATAYVGVLHIGQPHNVHSKHPTRATDRLKCLPQP